MTTDPADFSQAGVDAATTGETALITTTTRTLSPSVIALSPDEDAELRRNEEVIRRGRLIFYQVGEALAAIKKKKLYRISHATFESYCLDMFDMSRAYAYRVMDAAETFRVVSPVGDIASERQARALAGLSPERKLEVYKAARASVPSRKDPSTADLLHTRMLIEPVADGRTARNSPLSDADVADDPEFEDTDEPESEVGQTGSPLVVAAVQLEAIGIGETTYDETAASDPPANSITDDDGADAQEEVAPTKVSGWSDESFTKAWKSALAAVSTAVDKLAVLANDSYFSRCAPSLIRASLRGPIADAIRNLGTVRKSLATRRS